MESKPNPCTSVVTWWSRVSAHLDCDRDSNVDVIYKIAGLVGRTQGPLPV